MSQAVAEGGPPPPAGGLRPLDRRLLGRARAAQRLLFIDAAAGVLATVLLLVQVSLLAAVVAGVVDDGLDGVSREVLAGLVLAVLGRAGLAYVVERSGRRAATSVMSSMRNDLVTQRLRHGGRELGHVDGVELATAAVQGVDSLETYFARYLPQLVLAVCVPIAVLAWSVTVDVQSTIIMVITLPLIPIFMVLIGRAAESRSRAHWLSLVTLSAHFLDVVRGLPTLRAFNRGRAQIPKIEAATDAYRRTTMSTLRLAFLSGFVLDLATTLSTALVAVTLGVRLVEGGIGLRPALTILLLVPELYAPIRAVGALYHASADGLAAAERILDLLDDAGPEVPVDAANISLPDPRTTPVRLRGIALTYPGRSVPALDGVDLDLEPGELLAIVGPSGSGKTTLGRVLLGVQRPDAGSVSVGDHLVTAVELDRWRRHLAWAPQHPTIVRGTVVENIALGVGGATVDDVRAAASAAAVDRFVDEWPDGFDTVLGPGGRGVSAGQRQRLGLARALWRDAALVVLDEPTAHLDASTATHVIASIASLRGTRTTVVLTHDDELAAVATRRLTLIDGRVNEFLTRGRT